MQGFGLVWKALNPAQPICNTVSNKGRPRAARPAKKHRKQKIQEKEKRVCQYKFKQPLQFQYLQYIIQYQTILQFDEAIFIHLNHIFIHLNPIGDFSSVI